MRRPSPHPQHHKPTYDGQCPNARLSALQIARVPRQPGYFEHPQNCDPAFAPFLAVRFTMADAQTGQAVVTAAPAETGAICGAPLAPAEIDCRACLINPNSLGPL